MSRRPPIRTCACSLRLIPYSDELWLLVARDVSKMMRLEQMRRDFVANVSHELRTPLTVVHGYLDMLDPEEIRTGRRCWRKCNGSRSA
jgi:signal transduction histidine kinase